ncbi:MAG: hypothetical protein J6T70_18310 [Bacteroidales bacterium]|nr:hypothetical protein [Bacteroidales bacterium]
MKTLLILTILCGLFSCSGNANPPGDGKLPDKKTMSVIKKAEKVVYYELDPMSDESTKYQIDGVPTTGFSKELNKTEQDSLTLLLTENIKKVRKDGKGKFCPYAPQDAFLFIKGKDTVKLVVDFNCASYCIINDTLIYEYDFEKYYDNVSKVIKPIRKMNSFLSNSISDTDSTKNLLTDKMKQIIIETDSVICYLLDPLDKNSKDTLNGFCILERKCIDTELVDTLQNILLDKRMFVYSGIVKNCTFLCDMAFRLFSKGEYTDVLFAFYCDDCVVIHGNEHIKVDSGNFRKRILEVAKSAFPKDRYIRFMLNQ